MKSARQLLLATVLASFGCAGEPAADTVFINGRIYTVNEAQPWVEAVARSPRTAPARRGVTGAGVLCRTANPRKASAP